MQQRKSSSITTCGNYKSGQVGLNRGTAYRRMNKFYVRAWLVLALEVCGLATIYA